MDPSLIDKYRERPEVKYMIDKIEACRKKLQEKGLMPSQPSQAPSLPFQMPFSMRNQ